MKVVLQLFLKMSIVRVLQACPAIKCFFKENFSITVFNQAFTNASKNDVCHKCSRPKQNSTEYLVSRLIHSVNLIQDASITADFQSQK